jgi:integrase
MNKGELQTLLFTVQELYPRYYPFFLCAARTRMRLAELLALEWGHVDFHGRCIEVRQSFSRHRLTSPKNKLMRKVDMSMRLVDVLKTNKTQMRENAFRLGVEMPKWVFTQENGKRITATSIANSVYYRCLDRAGLRKVRFHDIRHSFASILIQQGESLAYVRDQMGHHSIQITVDIYGHMAPEGNKSAVDRLDDESGAIIRNPSATSRNAPIEIIEKKEKWSGRRDSNPRPSAWKADALAS